MKLRLLLFCAFIFSATSLFAQLKLPQVLKEAANAVKPGSPSQLEISDAIKEALEIGVSAGTDRLSAENGFLGNATIKLLFPPEARKVEKALRGIGMNKACDDFILTINRAAELAAKEAKPLFISAIKEMSVQDASNILMSDQKNAATSYFQRVTSTALAAKFKPVIQGSMDKTQATKYWSELSTAYNQIPLAGKVNTDLADYATQKAMEGLFLEIAQEELKLRENSGLRNSPLLKKVYGYADKSKNGLSFR
jgi:hypothetical protein